MRSRPINYCLIFQRRYIMLLRNCSKNFIKNGKNHLMLFKDICKGSSYCQRILKSYKYIHITIVNVMHAIFNFSQF